MRNTCLRAIVMLGLFLTLSVASARAQSPGPIEVNIPFDFTAGETKLKSGHYTVKRLSKSSLLFRTVDNKSVIVLAPMSVYQHRNDVPERLVFNRYGSEYFLAQVWTNRTGDGLGLSISKAEGLIAKQALKTRQRVEVAAMAK